MIFFINLHSKSGAKVRNLFQTCNTSKVVNLKKDSYEEGKINGLPLNRALRDEDGEIYDVVAGPFLVVGLTEDNFGSLNQDQIRNFEDHFHQPEAFMKMGRGIMAIPIPDETIEAMKKSEKAFADREKAPKVKKPERDDH